MPDSSLRCVPDLSYPKVRPSWVEVKVLVADEGSTWCAAGFLMSAPFTIVVEVVEYILDVGKTPSGQQTAHEASSHNKEGSRYSKTAQ